MPHFEKTHGTVSFFAVLAHILLGRYSCLPVNLYVKIGQKPQDLTHLTPQRHPKAHISHLAALPPQRSTCAAVYRPNLGYPEETLFGHTTIKKGYESTETNTHILPLWIQVPS